VAGTPDEEADPEQVLMGLYGKLIKAHGWNLRELDETNLETLFDFLTYKDPNERIINGKVYRRATAPPKWL